MGDSFCFETLLLLASFVMSLVALVRSSKARDELHELRTELATLRRNLFLGAKPPATTAPPEPAPIPPPSPQAAPTPPPSQAQFPPVAEVVLSSTPPAAPPCAAPPAPAAPRPALPQIPPAPAPRKPALSLEQQLIRLAVWIGGFAFALAGIFLVKVAADHGILNPPVRVSLATLFGIALLIAGIWRRNKEPNIAQALSAAAVADLFACILAAGKLYHFPYFTPTVTFLLLAATTALAVFLSLRQGPFVALLGLVGGFLTPALINTGHPSAASLFGYLILLHVGLLTVTRARGWSWLAALTVLCSFAWVCIYAVTVPFTPADAPILGTFVLLATAIVAITAGLQEDAWHSNPLPLRVLTYGTLLAGFALSTFLLTRSNFSNTEWLFLGLLSAGLFILARIRPLYEPFAWFAAAFLLVLLTAWGLQYPADIDRLRLLLPTFGILSALGAYACLWGSRQPVRWAALSVLCALAYTPLAYGLLDHAPRSDAWALLPTSVAILYAARAFPIFKRRTTLPTGEQTLSALALGALISLACAPPMWLEGTQLTAAWSLLLPLTLFLSIRLALPALRSFAMIIAALVTLLLVLNPDLLNYSTGPALLWNPLLWAYVPALASFLVAMFLLDRANLLTLSRLLQAAIACIAAAFITLFTHRCFHDDSLNTPFTGLMERSTYPVIWLLLAALFYHLGSHFKRPVLTSAGHLLTLLTLFFLVLVQVLLFNPLWNAEPLGSMIILNKLLYLYALPAVLITAQILWAAKRDDGPAQLPLAPFASIIALLLLFVFVSLEIRHAFHGPVLDISAGQHLAATLIERSTNAALWLLLAFPFLALGRQLKNDILTAAGDLFAALGILFVFGIQLFFLNPLWSHDDVGSLPVFNQLLYALGLPALLTGALAYYLSQSNTPGATLFSRIAGISALLILFSLVSLEVRQAFQGRFLDIALHPSVAENYAYSAAWAVLGTALLVAGILTRGTILRFASLAVMLATIIKVFLFDTAHLSDIYRVLSFAGLGLSLILLGLLYHYFVFRKPVAPTPELESTAV
ncbi:MAG: DUF2339 domain-containing protein [Phycisphaerae bacterium]